MESLMHLNKFMQSITEENALKRFMDDDWWEICEKGLRSSGGCQLVQFLEP